MVQQQQSSQTPNSSAGSIIGISSISALVGGGQQTHYTPTKAGILSLMQSCAVSLGKYRIRCNALLPGTIRTQLNDADMADDKKREYMEGRIPLGRLGKTEDMAGPAVFLASDLSGYVVSKPLSSFNFVLWRYMLTISPLSIDWCTTTRRWGIICQSSVEYLTYLLYIFIIYYIQYINQVSGISKHRLRKPLRPLLPKLL